MRTLKATGAALALLSLVFGPPLLLVNVIGNPYPAGGLDPQAPLSDGAILGTLTVLSWLLWAQLMLCLLAEGHALLVDRPVSRRLPVFALQQDLARVLLAALIVTTIASPPLSSALAHAAAPVPSNTGTHHTAPGQATSNSEAGTRPARAEVARRTTGTASVTAAGHNPNSTHPTTTGQTTQTTRPTTRPIIVERGDTLWSLAEAHLGDGARWADIAAANDGRTMADGSRFTSADLIRPGWELLVPVTGEEMSPAAAGPEGGYLVHPGDTLWEIAERELGDGADFPRIFEANRNRPQGAGGALADPDHIETGWHLLIPGNPGASTRHHGRVDPAAVPGTGLDLPPRPDTTDRGVDAPARTHSPDAAPGAGTGHPTAPDRAATGDHASAADAPEAVAMGDISALRALLATGLCLAAGSLLLLLGHRARQWRERRAGRTLAPIPVDLRAAERAVLETGAAARDDVDFLDRALRHLALHQRVTQQMLPPVRAVVLGREGVTLHLDGPFTATMPAAWMPDPTRTTWHLPGTADVGHAELAEQPAPYPALVTVGVDEAAGDTWLLDLETVGDLRVAGHPDQVEELLRCLAAELALSTWSHGIEVLLVDGIAAEVAELRPGRVAVVPADAARRRLAAVQDATTDDTDLLTARRDRRRDGTSPLVLVTCAPLGTADLSPDGHPRSRVVVIRPSDAEPTLNVRDDGRVTLHPWNLTLTALLLNGDQARTMTALNSAAGRLDDAPMPEATGTSTTSRLSRADGALREAHVTGRDAGDLTTSLLPRPDDDYLQASATTTADLAALAPAANPGVELLVLDPGLDGDLADWHDPGCRRPKVHVLGPVSVDAHGPAKASVTSLGATIEFIVYLACQDHGVTPERAADALNWSERTIWNRALDARKYLGQRPDGTDWLPEAPKSPTARARGVATYELHPKVLVSADLFRRLRLRGQARGPAGIEDLEDALTLVTGEPFDQLRRGGYGWLLEGDRLDHHLTVAVIDTAHVVATAALAAGDPRRARRACEIARAAAPHADGPSLDLAAVRAAQNAAKPDDHLRDTLTDDQEDPPARTEEVLRRHNWLVG